MTPPRRPISIRFRILTACLTLTALTAALGLFTLEGENELGSLALQIYDKAFMSVNYFRSAQAAFCEMGFAYKTGESAPRLQMFAAEVDADLEVAIERASSDEARRIASDLRKRTLEIRTPTVDRARIGEIIGLIKPMFEVGAEQFAQDGFAIREQAEAIDRDSRQRGEFAVAASLLAALLITAILTRSIVPPLRRATAIARELARGNLNNTIRATGSQEIGQLLAALGTMQTGLAERAIATQRAEHLAHHDLLTGLGNRLAFSKQMDDALSRQPPEPFALLLIDLDRFKPVNDTFGHAAGDELLNAVAKRITRCVAISDMVARIGGDEFAILHRIVGNASAEQTARRVVTALSRPFGLSNGAVTIGASVGVKLWLGESDGDELFRAADTALYAVKNSGRGGWRSFDSDAAAGLPACSPATSPVIA